MLVQNFINLCARTVINNGRPGEAEAASSKVLAVRVLAALMLYSEMVKRRLVRVDTDSRLRQSAGRVDTPSVTDLPDCRVTIGDEICRRCSFPVCRQNQPHNQ